MNKYLKTQIALTTAMIVHDRLSTGIASIEFYKADDSVRPMRATTDPSLLPNTTKTDTEMTLTAIDLNLVKVFDVEKQAWRSFKIDKLKSVDGVELEEFVVSKFTAGM